MPVVIPGVEEPFPTVAELIDVLRGFDPHAPVAWARHGGYEAFRLDLVRATLPHVPTAEESDDGKVAVRVRRGYLEDVRGQTDSPVVVVTLPGD